MNIEQKLDQLADLQAQADVVRMKFNELRDQIMTPEIKAQLAEVDVEEATTLEAVRAGIDTLTAEVKDGVIAIGYSVKGKYLQAVWSRGRPSYSEKAKDGYLPVNVYRKEGEPSVSIRNVK